MKKLLLCTSALAALASWSAQADEMKVEFHGLSTFEAGYVNNDKNHRGSFEHSPNQRTSTFFTEQRASLKAENKADALTYGAVFNLQMVGNSSTGSDHPSTTRSYIYVDTDSGSVQLGSNVSASKMMKIDAGTIASATGGVDGDWTNFVQARDYVEGDGEENIDAKNSVSKALITGVDTLANRIESSQAEGSRKITYLSPVISGVQLAFSFAPDMSNKGTGIPEGSKNTVFYLDEPVQVRNLWSLGLNIKHTVNDMDLGLSLTSDMGTNNNNIGMYRTYSKDAKPKLIKTVKLRKLKTYAVGASVASKGFTLAASYQDDGKSLTNQNDPDLSNFKSNWWTVGLGYGQDKWSTSLTFLQGKKGTNDNNVKNTQLSLGADYEVVPGMKAFAEVTNLKATPKTIKKGLDSEKTKSTVFILGTYLKF